MIDQTSPRLPVEPTKEPTGRYLQRIAYSAKVFRITLRLAGTILLLVQIVKAFISAAEGEGFITLSIASAAALAILAIAATLPPFLENAITKFAARLRQPRFGLYIYVVSLMLTASILLIKIMVGPTSEQWRYMSSEGSISEYGTAIAYLLMPVFTIPIAKQFKRQGQRLMSSLYYLITAAAFFVGMEEISWGQRLLGYEEPEFWSKHNVQSEFTFHNFGFFQEHLLHWSFIIVSLIGSFCWIALRYWQKRRKIDQMQKIDWSYLLPDWPISSFFYPTLIFYMVIDTDLRDRYDFLRSADQEHWEFVMSLGILLFFVICFFRQAKDNDSIREKHTHSL